MIPQLRTFRLFLIKLICLLSININVNAEFRLTILHTNDMHARFEQTNELSGKCSVGDAKQKVCYGGFARLKEAVNKCKIDAKSRDRNVLFLNAGDTYQGTPYYKLFKWKIVARMFELLEIDAASLGNHEFDDGPDGLAPFIDNVTIPILCSNLDVSKVPVLQKTKLKNSTVFEFSGGIKIGVVGYLTPDTKIISNSGDTEFLPEIPCIQEEVNKLRNEGVFLIIALGHSGFQKDLEIAKYVQGVDIVVGGHTNTFLYNGEQPSTEDTKGPYPTIVTQDNGKKVPVVQAYAYTKYLGVIDLDFDDRGVLVKYKGNPMILNSTIAEDTEVLEALKPYKTLVDSQTSKEIGVTKVLLYGNDKTRLGESNLANFITDAYVDYNVRQYNGTGWTDSPIAIVQSGGIRSSIDAFTSDGIVTNTDVQTVLPFEDPLCRIEIKGKYLLEALEWSVSEYGIDGSNLAGAFLHVSGLKIVYDVSKPKGERVAKALAKCANCTIPIYSEVDPDKLYAILFSRYLAEGGDGFSMFKKNRVSFKKFPITDTSIVTDYFSKESPIYPGLEGRITIENFKLMSKNNAETLISSTILLTCLVIVYFIA